MPREPYQQRVIDEASSLRENLESLRAFISGDLFAQLKVAEQVRMRLQSHHMAGYLDILGSRIDNFES